MCPLPLLHTHSPAQERGLRESSEQSLSPEKMSQPQGPPSKSFTDSASCPNPPTLGSPPMRQKDILDFEGLLALTVPFSWNELPSNSPL